MGRQSLRQNEFRVAKNFRSLIGRQERGFLNGGHWSGNSRDWSKAAVVLSQPRSRGKFIRFFDCKLGLFLRSARF